MNDPSALQTISTESVSVNWFSWMLGVLVLLISAIGEVYRRRVDDHQKNHVTREELAAIVKQSREDTATTVRQNREDAATKHAENTNRLERIEDRVNALPSVATTIRVVKQGPTRRRKR